MTAGRSSDIYCLDADALINIQIFYPEALRLLNRFGKTGSVVIPEGVCREILKKSDRLKAMVLNWRKKHNAVINLQSPPLLMELRRMEEAYGERIQVGRQQRKGFWASQSGKRAADSQVVAVCKVLSYIAVSNDEAVQNACHLEDVPCIGWQEFYRRMKLGHSPQGLLFE